MQIYRHGCFVISRTRNLHKLKIIKPLDQRFVNVGRHHIAHDPVVIEYCHSTGVCAFKNGRRIFLQSEILTAISAKTLCMVRTSNAIEISVDIEAYQLLP